MKNNVVSAALFVFTSVQMAVAQPPSTIQAFTGGNVAQKRSMLVEVIRHTLPASSETVVDVIRLGLGDIDPVVREGALAAVVSRAATPRFTAKDAAVNADWLVDRGPIQRLRPQVIELLRDSDVRVRLEAIAALTSLDFSDVTPDLELAPGTQQILVERFYAESSANVRAKIADGFTTDPGVDSPAILKLLSDAFQDPDDRVRRIAARGAEKLGADGIALLVRQLTDHSRAVRLQAASVLGTVGAAGSAYLPAIEEALKQERDFSVQQRLRQAIARITRQN